MIRIEVADLDDLVARLEDLVDAFGSGLEVTFATDRAMALAARPAPFQTGRLSS